jgi:hypothetical protein
MNVSGVPDLARTTVQRSHGTMAFAEMRTKGKISPLAPLGFGVTPVGGQQFLARYKS